jgi:hypothetical protein
MKKKPPVIKFPKPLEIPRPDDRSWHNGGDIEIALYAMSLRRAAKKLIATLDLEPNLKTAWDACPVILVYRQAVELQLKTLIDQGGNFLPTPTDSITLYKTHSLRWLAQIVGQIIRAVRWESHFKCDGISTLAEFSAVVAELESLDPVVSAVTVGRSRRDGSVPHQLEPPKIVQFAKRLDALLDLLDVTADALAAMWDQQAIETDLYGDGNVGPTIQ